MYIKQRIGIIGEEIASNYLKSINYEILDRNFNCKQGEIDIIAKDKEEYVFVEVKTRTNKEYGEPVDAVNEIKKKHLQKAIEYYIYINKLENEYYNKFIDKTLSVLVEEVFDKYCTGHTDNYIKVIINKKLEHNKFYNVKIIKVDNCNVYGEVE